MALNETYDVGAAFDAIEDELIDSMMRNMKRHKVEEIGEDKQWTMWQTEQLKSLEAYRKQNAKKYRKEFSGINKKIENAITQAKKTGGMDQEQEVLQAILDGFPVTSTSAGVTGEFFKVNDRKLNALINATTSDMEKAETAILRKADDQYRKVIYNAQVYANTGAGTYEKAVDMATKDFLSAGITCVEYSNGAVHTLADYADMALRTAAKRAYLQGEGEKRQEWGLHLVIMNKRGAGCPCPKCVPFVGKIMIDDVWSGGSKEDGNYPLMSYAISCGLYHPRCKDSHTTYFPGVTTADGTWTQEELEEIGLENKQEARAQYAARQAKKYARLAKYSLDPENRANYSTKAEQWEKETAKERSAGMKQKLKDFAAKLRSDTDADRHKNLTALYAENTELVEDTTLKEAFLYDQGNDVIRYNPNAPNFEAYDLDYVFSHEVAHRMDEMQYRSFEDPDFLSAIDICAQKVYDNAELIQKWFDDGGQYEYNFALADIINALTKGDIYTFVGHDKDYWDNVSGSSAMEIFANISSLDVSGSEMGDTGEMLKELIDAYKKLVG